MSKSLYSVPVEQRPPATPLGNLNRLLFNVTFPLAMFVMHLAQLASQPLCLHPATHPLYERSATWFKDLFGRLLVVIVMVWAPTTLRITLDRDDKHLSLDGIVQRNETGKAIGLKLPDRMILMANHQAYCDWNYIWNILYLANLHSFVIIMMKASLKWIPLVGPAMQMFRFIFMQKNWLHDRAPLALNLRRLSSRASKGLNPFALLIFPEGTLVSPETRSASLKYAEKTGIIDLKHTLLPRSTGLLFCLRTLAPTIPGLRLLDFTIAYPGVPDGGYGQSYYTLQSVFGAGLPPPLIHVHLRSYSVLDDLPIGQSTLIPSKTSGENVTEEAESREFNDWLLQRWREKDERLGTFLREATFAKDLDYIDIPIKLKSYNEIVALIFSWALGFWIARTISRLLMMLFRAAF